MSILASNVTRVRDTSVATTLFNGATAPATSDVQDVADYATATIHAFFSASPSGIEIKLYGRRASGYPDAQLVAYDEMTGQRVRSITREGLYRVDITGLGEFYAEIEAVSSGVVTVYLLTDRAPAPLPMPEAPGFIEGSTVVQQTGETVDGRAGPHVHVASLRPGRLHKILQRSGTLAAGADGNLDDHPRPFVLEYLEWATDSPTSVRMRFGMYIDGVEQPFNISVAPSGGAVSNAFTPANILNNRSGFWEILEYNESANFYKFALARPLCFVEGGTIKIQNVGATNQNAGVFGLVRRL